jgi:hypothetical protein
VLLWLLLPPLKSPVTRAAFERIRPGMTLAEVEEVLGGPPGHYETGEVDLDLSRGTGEFFNIHLSMEVLLGKRQFRHEWWKGDEGLAWVCFDEQGRVVTKEFTPGRRVPSSPWERVRLWLKRLGW